MSRSCLAEEDTIASYVEELLRKQVPYEVGLLVGKLAVGSRDLLYALVKTPDADGEGPAAVKVAAPSAAKKKGAKAPAGQDVILPIDAEWIEEHARQVSRLLPGGVAIVGLYAFCSEGSFKASLPALQRAAAALPAAVQSGGEALVLHADSTSRNKFAAKRFDGKPGSAARAAELKFGKVLPQVHCAEALYPLDVEVPAGGGATLAEAAREALRAEAGRVAAAEVAFGAALPPGAEQVCKVLGDSGLLGGSGPAQLSLFRPPPCVSAGAASASAPAAAPGAVRIRGCVAARAFAYAREPWSRLVENIKEDIVASLTGRLELLVEDAERADEEQEEEAAAAGAPAAGQRPRPALLSPAAQAQPAVLAMPRRVAVPWVQGLEVCDYLHQSEAASDAVSRVRELLGSGVAEGSAARDLEQPGDSAELLRSSAHGGSRGAEGGASSSKGGGAAGAAAGGAGGAGGGAGAAGATNFATAAGVAALAALMGVLVIFDDQLFDLI